MAERRSETLMHTKRTVPRTQEHKGLPSGTSCGQKIMQLLTDSPDYKKGFAELGLFLSPKTKNTHETFKCRSWNCIVKNSYILLWYNKHWFSLKCHIWQHSMMSISVRPTTRRHPILSQVSSPLAQSASLVCHIELSRPEHRHINREHHSVGSSQ